MSSERLPPLDDIRPEHVAYVHAILGHLRVRPEHVRDDLVQEVLIRAHRGRDRPLPIGAQLHILTRYAVLAACRGQRRAARHLEQLERECPSVAMGSPAPAPDAGREEADRRELVHAALAELPEIFRQVLVRVELDGETTLEVAADMGLNPNTAKDRLRLARQRLAETLHRHLVRRRLKPDDL